MYGKLSGKIIKTSLKAILLDTGTLELWLPKSRVVCTYDKLNNDIVLCDEWLTRKLKKSKVHFNDVLDTMPEIKEEILDLGEASIDEDLIDTTI